MKKLLLLIGSFIFLIIVTYIIANHLINKFKEVKIDNDTIDQTTTVVQPKTIEKNNNAKLKTITILNYSHLDDKYLYKKAFNAEAMIAEITSRTLLVLYPLGNFISNHDEKTVQVVKGWEGKSYQSVISPEQISQIMKDISVINKTGCQNSYQLMKDLKSWIEAGRGGARNYSLCDKWRLITIGIPNFYDLKFTEDQVMVDHKLYHELYHSFQKNLYEKNCKKGPDDFWITEGAASYFADYMSFRDYGWMNSFPSGILKYIHVTKWKNRKLTIPVGIPEYDKREYYDKGILALRLMIEKGWLKESALLNGTLFDNCNYKKISISSNLQFIKDNFDKVEIKKGCEFTKYSEGCGWIDGLYFFNESVLSD